MRFLEDLRDVLVLVVLCLLLLLWLVLIIVGATGLVHWAWSHS